MDYQKAYECFKKASNNGYKYANNNLSFLYLNGLGTERNYKEAFNRLTTTSGSDKYLINILKLINSGSKVIYLNNISEFREDCLNENDIVIIKSQDRINYNDYYTVKMIREIFKVINNIINDVNLQDAEINRFIEIYVKLAKYLSYDKEAYNKKEYTEYVLEKATTSRNLIGLLTGNCICTGYADILFNVLSCVNIESKILTSIDHSFNKVKINNKWYYCDLTLDSKNIVDNKLQYCLLSKKEFEDELSHIAFDDFDELGNSDISYFNVNELYNSKIK